MRNGVHGAGYASPAGRDGPPARGQQHEPGADGEVRQRGHAQ